MVNVNTALKYSLDALEGDGWEVRRAKQMIRFIARERSRGTMTTQELARRCSKFLGADDAIKTSTLNGLFAGKRKSLSVAELEMFASVLGLAVDEIMYPAGEQIEVRPGEFLSSADALVNAFSVSLPSAVGSIRVGRRAEAAFAIVKSADEIEDVVVRAIGSWRLGALAPITLGHRLVSLAYTPKALQRQLETYRSTWRDEPPTLSEGVRALLSIDLSAALEGEDPNIEMAMQMLLPLESYFVGYVVGGYRLGGGGEPTTSARFVDGDGNLVAVPHALFERRLEGDNGEHQATT